MNEAAAVWFQGLDPACLFALDVASKAAVLCLLALLLDFALGRRRVLARSAVWNACLLGLLLLPWATWACPEWSIACLAGEDRPHDAPPPIAVAIAADPSVDMTGTFAADELPRLGTAAHAHDRISATSLVVGLYLAGIAFFALRLVRDWRAVRA